MMLTESFQAAAMRVVIGINLGCVPSGARRAEQHREGAADALLRAAVALLGHRPN